MYRRESPSGYLLLQLTGILAAILAGQVLVDAQSGKLVCFLSISF
jgi:hypothetical protein